jgi:hypothetical protein
MGIMVKRVGAGTASALTIAMYGGEWRLLLFAHPRHWVRPGVVCVGATTRVRCGPVTVWKRRGRVG